MFLFLQFQPFRGLCAALRTPALFLRARHILRQLRRRLVQHGHKFIAGDGLFFVQVLGQLIQLAAVLQQQLGRLFMLLFHQGHHLPVNVGLGFGRAGQRGIAAQILVGHDFQRRR